MKSYTTFTNSLYILFETMSKRKGKIIFQMKKIKIKFSKTLDAASVLFVTNRPKKLATN